MATNFWFFCTARYAPLLVDQCALVCPCHHFLHQARFLSSSSWLDMTFVSISDCHDEQLENTVSLIYKVLNLVVSTLLTSFYAHTLSSAKRCVLGFICWFLKYTSEFLCNRYVCNIVNSKGHPFTDVIVHIDVHGVRLLCIVVCLMTAFGELTVEFVY